MANDPSPRRFSRLGRLVLGLGAVAATLAGSATVGPTAPAPASAASRSIVTVHARGRLGTEDMELRINDNLVWTWDDIGRSAGVHSYPIEDTVTVERLRVAVSSDGGWPASLIVDKIEIDGTTYQTEAADTGSQGSWTAGTGCGVGYKMSEWLQCRDGWFDYESARGRLLVGSSPGPPTVPGPVEPPPAAADGVISVRARGRLGTEDMELRVNGRRLAAWSDISTGQRVYRFQADVTETIESLQVGMIGGGWPQALIVDKVELGDVAYESESGNTGSQGSWTATTGCGRGNKRSEWLHCHNAYFDYTQAAGVVLVGAAAAPPPDRPHLLVMTKSSVFTHPSIENGLALVERLSREQGFDLTHSNDSSLFEDQGAVGDFDAVLFLNTDSVVFESDVEKNAFRRFIEAGKGFIGIHGAAATHWNGDKWDWYRDLVGQRFVDHPTTPNQSTTVRIVDRAHPSTSHLPGDTWQIRDEWYNFEAVPADVEVLLAVDESTYSGGTMGPWHPIAWTHHYGPGRSPVWYTNLGHEPALYGEADYIEHVRGGIAWVLGEVADGG